MVVAITIDSTCIPIEVDSVAFGGRLTFPWAQRLRHCYLRQLAWELLVDAAAIVVAAMIAAAGAYPDIESVPWSMRCDRRWRHIRDPDGGPLPRTRGGS